MDIKNYWETEASPSYAHLIDEKGRGLESDSKVLELYKKSFLDKIDFKSKVVVDYGIGGGWLGRYLFMEKDIAKYVGIDIAQRSINKASTVLKQWKYHCDFALAPVDFLLLKADIFISLACIQHFSSKEYLVDFLNNINRSGIDTVVLQIRYSEKTGFNNAYGIENGDVGQACRTNKEFLSEYLLRYEIVSESEINEKSKYQYLIFKFN